VIIISFGDARGAQKWKEDTNCKFPMYLDPERNVYKYFKMHRSISTVSNFGNVTSINYHTRNE